MSTNSGLGIQSTGVTANGAPLQQVTGLASGLDTNTIINELMSIERQPLLRLQQQTALEQTRQSDLQKIQTQLQTFNTSLQSLRDPTVWGDVQSVQSSNSSALTVTRTSGAAAGAFTFNVTQLARAAQSTQGTSLAAANANDTLTVKVGSNSINVAINAGDSIDTIATKIRTTVGTPVYASTVNGKLVLSSTTTGAGNDIVVTSSGTLAADLGMTENITPQNALYTRDGGSQVSSQSNTLTSELPGLSITLLGTGTTTVTVGSPAPDTSSISNTLQSFVTAYNQTVDMVYQKLNEKKVVNPQTDADRAAGDLNGDPQLISLLSQLRTSVSSAFQGNPAAMQLLSQVGLSTGQAIDNNGNVNTDALEGKLTLDTNALSTALNSNFSAVKALFTNPTGTFNTEGLSQRLNDVVFPFLQSGGVFDSRLQAEASTIKDLQDQQTELNVRLNAKQQALQAQFANLETALSQEQSQGSWLSSQIAGLSANG
ncbi:MAG: flagellar filament capping protein FliD [Actinobacteria bacterium]|nr:flagellar filament capping protein FliD [Actinomycetota bacterium]